MEQNTKEKIKIWRERIRDWRDSGLTQARFCRENGLALATFGFWKRRLSRTVESQFIKLPRQEAQGDKRLKLIIPGGVKITFGETSPLRTITAVLETLCGSTGVR
jgi:hypothetical protein